MESHLIIIRNYDNRMVCACSNCNKYIASPSNGNGYDYCYHCGAKFDEHVSARRIREFKKNARYDKGENNMENVFRMVDKNADVFDSDLTFILKTDCSREKLEEIEKNADKIWHDCESEELDEEYKQFVPNLYGISKVEIMEIIVKDLGYSWEVVYLEEVEW